MYTRLRHGIHQCSRVTSRRSIGKTHFSTDQPVGLREGWIKMVRTVTVEDRKLRSYHLES